MGVFLILTEPSTWIVLVITALFYIYRKGTSNFDFFSKQGIPGPKPMPFIGTTWGIWKINRERNSRERAKKFGKLYGTFEGMTPHLIVNDAELIKSIFIKDFDHFINRRFFRYFMLRITGQTWKDVRSAITPSFTTGKIKQYSVQMKQCSDLHCLRLRSIATDQGKLNLKEEMGILATSIIAKCAFGMTVDNLGRKDDPFIENANALANPPQINSPKLLLFFLLPPRLLKWMAGNLVPRGNWQYFFDLMDVMMKERSKTTQKYYDFPEMAAEAISSYTKEQNGKTVPMWSKEEVDEIVTAQSTLFIVGGNTTVSNALTSCCFMLARHPNEQEKLYDLIMSKIEQYGDVCHELIQDIPYLDQFVNEVLRMYPAAPAIERHCNKEVNYNGIKIIEGMMVSVQTHALHYSEDYYTDPETFNPDRWSPENKANINHYFFKPFGLGPSNCVAMRFAQEELKLVLCNLIKQFRFFAVDETLEKLTTPDGFGAGDPINSTVGIA